MKSREGTRASWDPASSSSRRVRSATSFFTLSSLLSWLRAALRAAKVFWMLCSMRRRIPQQPCQWAAVGTPEIALGIAQCVEDGQRDVVHRVPHGLRRIVPAVDVVRVVVDGQGPAERASFHLGSEGISQPRDARLPVTADKAAIEGPLRVRVIVEVRQVDLDSDGWVRVGRSAVMDVVRLEPAARGWKAPDPGPIEGREEGCSCRPR